MPRGGSIFQRSIDTCGECSAVDVQLKCVGGLNYSRYVKSQITLIRRGNTFLTVVFIWSGDTRTLIKETPLMLWHKLHLALIARKFPFHDFKDWRKFVNSRWGQKTGSKNVTEICNLYSLVTLLVFFVLIIFHLVCSNMHVEFSWIFPDKKSSFVNFFV